MTAEAARRTRVPAYGPGIEPFETIEDELVVGGVLVPEGRAQDFAGARCGETELDRRAGHDQVVSVVDVQELPQSSPSERFKQFLEQDSWVNAVYGLMRSDALKETSIMGTFPGSDIVVMAEMSLHGKFFELPDCLFFRRIHPDAFSYECSTEKQQEFYNPGKKKQWLPMYNWRHLYEHLRSTASTTAAPRRRLPRSECASPAPLASRRRHCRRGRGPCGRP